MFTQRRELLLSVTRDVERDVLHDDGGLIVSCLVSLPNTAKAPK